MNIALLQAMGGLGGGGGVIPFKTDILQQVFFNSPYFNTPVTEVVDGQETENFDLVESNCLYKDENSAFFEAVNDILLDQDFEVSFYIQPNAADNTGSPFDKYATYGISFKPRRLAGTVNTQILIKGTTKSATFTTLEALSTTAFTKVTIKRVVNSLTIRYNEILKSTIDLTPYGSIEDIRKLRIYPGLMKTFNYNIYQGSTHIAHLPCSEGMHSATIGLFNSVGTDWNYSSTGYSSNYAGIFQNLYHFNLQNGFSLFHAYQYNMDLWLPFKNGQPQVKTGMLYGTTPLLKVADFYPGFNAGAETKIKFKTNLLNLSDRAFYLDVSGNPKGIKFRDLVSLEGKVFIDKSLAVNPRILTYTTEKTAPQKITVKKYIKDNPVELWCCSGQSNMGSGANLSELTELNDNLTIYAKTWNVADQIFYYSNTVKGTHENPRYQHGFGIITPFARLRANNAKHLHFVHFWANGTCVFNDGTTNNWNVNTVGGLWSQFIAQIDAAIVWLQARDIQYVIRYFDFQGEGDASIAERANQYKTNKQAQITDFFTRYGVCPYFNGQISPANGSHSASINQYLTELASENNGHSIITSDLTYNVDNIHLDGAGKIGFARKLNALL